MGKRNSPKVDVRYNIGDSRDDQSESLLDTIPQCKGPSHSTPSPTQITSEMMAQQLEEAICGMTANIDKGFEEFHLGYQMEHQRLKDTWDADRRRITDDIAALQSTLQEFMRQMAPQVRPSFSPSPVPVMRPQASSWTPREVRGGPPALPRPQVVPETPRTVCEGSPPFPRASSVPRVDMSRTLNGSGVAGPKVPIFEGKVSTDFRPWLVQFRAIAHYNGWEDEEKVIRLVSSLHGPAASLLTGMSIHQLSNYGALVERLRQRFDPPEREEAYRGNFAHAGGDAKSRRTTSWRPSRPSHGEPTPTTIKTT